MQTRTAQMQDKVEQQHLKRLVLQYEKREETEELRGALIPYRGPRSLLKKRLALEARTRNGAIRIRYAG